MINAKLFQFGLNCSPPFWGTGIHVAEIAADYRYVKVIMKLRFYNRNFMKVHFGGNIFSMIDPFPALQFIQILGPEYVVWDKSAHINFKKPGKTTLSAELTIANRQLDLIKSEVVMAGKYLLNYPVEIYDSQHNLVTSVDKVLYFAKNP